MAKSTITDTIYDVTIEGIYAARTEHGSVEKPYKVTVPMDKEHLDAGPVSAFCKGYADKKLRKHYPDYIRFITHTLLSITPRDGSEITDYKLMSYDQLVNFIEDNDLPVDYRLYDDTESIRTAIGELFALRHKGREEDFIEGQKRLDERKGAAVGLKIRAAKLMEEDDAQETAMPEDEPAPEEPEHKSPKHKKPPGDALAGL